MGRLLDFITGIHKSTPREYLPRMVDDKVTCMKTARLFDRQFWDGDRRFGYGGYSYDGRWATMARQLIEYYKLQPGARILDVGCGKGYLLYEFTRLLPGCQVTGFDVSEYAVDQAKEEVKDRLFIHDAGKPFPFEDKQFDLAISLNAIHNLALPELAVGLTELNRVGRNAYLVVESYRSVEELFNLQCWALTCEAFFRPQSWVWLFEQVGYSGDYEFIYFE